MAKNYNVIGRHYLQRGDREKGLVYLKKAQQLAPFYLKYTLYFIKGFLPGTKFLSIILFDLIALLRGWCRIATLWKINKCLKNIPQKQTH